MPRLTHRRSSDSIRSWWSDSNSQGPTINLHAATKPLMRVLYRRQALAFLARNRDTPLSTDTMEIYSSYLTLKYLSGSTKAAVLSHLCSRVLREDEAHIAVLDLALLPTATELLTSRDTNVRVLTCSMLRHLAQHETTAAAVLAINPCTQLESLLRDDNHAVVEGAANALFWIAHSPEARHESTSAAVLAVKPCRQLASLLWDDQRAVVESAEKALFSITHSIEGSQDLDALECVAELLESQNAQVIRSTCELFVRLSSQETTAVSVLQVNPCPQLISLLHDENQAVLLSASEALYWIAKSPEGAQAAVNAHFLDSVAELYQSPIVDLRRWTCKIHGELVRHETLAAAVFCARYSTRLVALLRDKARIVVRSAAQALCWMIASPEGAQAALKANVLQYIPEMLGTPEPVIRARACTILCELASHQMMLSPVLAIRPCHLLVALFRDANLNIVVTEWALYALSQIATVPEGAETALNAGVLDYIADFFESPKAQVRRWACKTLGKLAYHKSIATSVLGSQLVSLLHDDTVEVVECALYALYGIIASTEGVQAALDGDVLVSVFGLMESPNVGVRRRACEILGRLVQHKFIAREILNSRLYTQLPPLLRGQHSEVLESAAYALNRIVASADGAQAVMDARVVASAFELLNSPSPNIRRWARQMLRCLLKQESMFIAILGSLLYEQLVSTLQ
ncbi:armadillo-type protein [Mycena rosella]|uniref:Armadillo-type protein n=1 Tax=Mycena rosella TaxID=1033263 RepID=A0AAD7CQ42_MYCRO|nr:armadillo-type protein [Mycena rosella]